MISMLRCIFLFLSVILITGYFVTPTMSIVCNCKRNVIKPHICRKYVRSPDKFLYFHLHQAIDVVNSMDKFLQIGFVKMVIMNYLNLKYYTILYFYMLISICYLYIIKK
ncbi:uncharacterized protein LOC102680633 [Apis dorsata]|uniref:uncharacterized protein LOC102680633 n=1 Tax=Apis dorsata TaxID=7462 RepID=UPI0003DF6A2B|nr:uncharacterized protein LOC102680633 [Apis dorsata]